MSNASENSRRTDEIVAAVTTMRDQRDALLDERERLADELAELREQLANYRDRETVTFTMPVPGGRTWAFHEEAQVLAISPELDEATRRRLLAQIEPPALTTCRTCGAPVYVGAACGMCVGRP